MSEARFGYFLGGGLFLHICLDIDLTKYILFILNIKQSLNSFVLTPCVRKAVRVEPTNAACAPSTATSDALRKGNSQITRGCQWGLLINELGP